MLLISNTHHQTTMSSFSLLGLTSCGQSDADKSLYCLVGAQADCCESGVGRISIPSWDIHKRQEYASISASFVPGFESSYESYTTLYTTATKTGSTIRVTETITRRTTSQTLSPSEAPFLPSASDPITTTSTHDPETLATSTGTFDKQVSPTNSGLSTGTKAGIGIGAAVAVLLIIGLGAAASIFYRRSKHTEMRNNEDNDARASEVEEFAADRMIPEMDARQSARPAELEDIVLSKLLGSLVSRAASRSRRIIEATRGDLHEMEA
jgi:hypothetical protein